MESTSGDVQQLLHPPYLVIIAVTVWMTGILLYQLYFSPLSRLPGPWLTKISTTPEANALKAQRRARWVTELFEQNPDAVAIRTGPNSVSFNSPEAIKSIYGKYTHGRLVRQVLTPPRPWEDRGRLRQVQLVQLVLDNWRISVFDQVEEAPCHQKTYGRSRLQCSIAAALRAICRQHHGEVPREDG